MAHHFYKYAGVAELADALDLGSSAYGVGVRLPSPAPNCGRSSVGRAQPCQGWGREFESRRPLQKIGHLFGRGGGTGRRTGLKILR
jgi:hypothetical protein